MFRFIRHFFADIKTDLFHSSLLLSGSLVAQVIAFIAYPILTRLYSPAEFGKFSVFLSITGILSILATGRLEYALMIPKEETKAHDLKKIGLWWCSIFSVACLLITFLLALFKGLSSHVPGLFFISIYVFLTGTTQIFTLYRNRLKQYQKLAQVSVIQNAITSAGKILLGFAGSLNVGLIFGSIMGQVASFISISKGLMEKTIFTKPARLKETLREYSAFPKYRMVQALINTFSSNMPIFLIAFYFSAREAGYFGLILGLGYKVITLISSALYQVLYRRFTEEKNLQNPVLPLFLKMSILLALISIVPGIPLFFISQKLIDVFCGHGWSERLPSSLLISVPPRCSAPLCCLLCVVH